MIATMKAHLRPSMTISSTCSKAYQQMLLVPDRSPTYNVERIRNPEANKIPCTPLSAFGFNCDHVNSSIRFSPTQLLLTRLQIMIVQHQLGVGQAWLRLHRYLVCEVRESGIF